MWVCILFTEGNENAKRCYKYFSSNYLVTMHWPLSIEITKNKKGIAVSLNEEFFMQLGKTAMNNT